MSSLNLNNLLSLSLNYTGCAARKKISPALARMPGVFSIPYGTVIYCTYMHHTWTCGKYVSYMFSCMSYESICVVTYMDICAEC